MAEMKYWLWLSGQSGISPRARAAVIEHYSDPERAYFAPTGEFASVPGLSKAEAERLEARDLSFVPRIVSDCARENIDIITMQDARYPLRLKNIYAPPVVIYVKGKLPDVDSVPAIAVIGTRKATPYGIKMGRKLAFEISRAGGTVISMLSDGADRAGAEGCLLAGGQCIGVLGTAHGRENSLQRDIIACGALVSEYAPGTQNMKSFFRDRNRIASGLSHGVAVVEAPEQSGCLLFAAEALEQGREVFAVPGNADSPNSVGSIGLIKQGAKAVTCGWDVMEEFEAIFPDLVKKPVSAAVPEVPVKAEEKKEEVKRQASTIKEVDRKKPEDYIDLRQQLSSLSEDQLSIINAIDRGQVHIDDIIETTGLPTAKVLSQLTILEIKGFVRRSAGKRISLNTKSK